MSSLIPFMFEDQAVRVLPGEDGLPLFVGRDVCNVLGYKDTVNAMKTHCKGVVIHHPLSTSGGLQEVRVLSEPDVMRLIIRSRLPAAQAFERWLFEEVLPTLRRTGRYEIPGSSPGHTNPAAPETIKAVLDAFRTAGTIARNCRALGMHPRAGLDCAASHVRELYGLDLLHLLGYSAPFQLQVRSLVQDFIEDPDWIALHSPEHVAEAAALYAAFLAWCAARELAPPYWEPDQAPGLFLRELLLRRPDLRPRKRELRDPETRKRSGSCLLGVHLLRST